MRVHLGTSNPVKVKAVRKALAGKAKLVSIEVPSRVAPQPLSFGETLKGAVSRAKAAMKGADLGIGVESGLFRISGTTFQVTLCAVTDGKRTTLGGGPFFELPDFAVKAILKGDDELGEVLGRKLKIKNPARGVGAIGVLTQGRVKRAELVYAAAMMALAPWFASSIYGRKLTRSKGDR